MLCRKAFGLILLINIALVFSASGAETIKMGLVAPMSGSFEPLGKQMQAGANAAAERFGSTIVLQDDQCTPEGGAAAARNLVAQKVNIAIGFTCLDSLSAALPILRDAGIATITTSVRADALTDNKAKSQYLLFRLAPREDMEIAALVAALLPRWRNENFAIIDDGTVQSRNRAEAFRFAVTEIGLKPVFTDTFRPGLENQAALVRRLQKAGATHVFVGGSIDDALIISGDAKGELQIAVGETTDPEGNAESAGAIIGVALPEYRLLPSAGQAAIEMQTKGVEPDNYALSVYAAVEIGMVAVKEPDIVGALRDKIFQTALGEITFDQNGDLKTNPFSLVVLKNGLFTKPTPSSQ